MVKNTTFAGASQQPESPVPGIQYTLGLEGTWISIVHINTHMYTCLKCLLKRKGDLLFEQSDFKNIKLPKMPNVKNTAIAHFQQSKSDKNFNVDIVITSQTQTQKRAVSVQTVEISQWLCQ